MVKTQKCGCEGCDPVRVEAYLGWISLAVFIGVFDIIAKYVGGMTLTEGFYRIRAHPVRHGAMAAVWALITVHLFDSRQRN